MKICDLFFGALVYSFLKFYALCRRDYKKELSFKYDNGKCQFSFMNILQAFTSS